MNDRIERRALLALSGAAIPTLALAKDEAGGEAAHRGRIMPEKQVVAVSRDNAVYGASSAAFEKYGYSPAVRAGGLLFIAGVVGVRSDGSVPDSVAEQAELAFRRTAEVLRLSGLAMTDLVEVVSYHVDLATTLADFLPVKERHFARPFPAWSIIGVEALARPVLKLEIRSVAAFRDQR